MTDPHPTSSAPADAGEPAPIPGERRLARPPSDRYRTQEPAPPEEDPSASPLRGVALGVIAAITGAVAIVLLGGVLAVSSGLLVAAAAAGWVVGIAIRAGAGGTLKAPARTRLAIGLAMLAIIAGQAGLWAFARAEGGVLGPLDYLGEVFGFLVPIELVAAGIAAWVTAR